jgi:signal transduction histidine kinase
VSSAGNGPGGGAAVAGWLAKDLPGGGRLGIRRMDAALTLTVAAAVELSVAVGGGSGAAPLDALAWVLGGLLAVPVLLRHRWPLQVLLACSVLLFAYYSFHRRNISPAPLLSLPLYDAALAGYLAWAIAIPAGYMAIGLFVVGASTHQSLVSLAAEFLPGIALLGLAVLLGEVVRGRRALAAETAQRLQAAQEERDAEAARQVAEERLRIARDLHDTVAHSMATIAVQAGSALHLLDGRDGNLRAALTAIRETSKEALGEMRTTLGQLRAGPTDGDARTRSGGLDRLASLRDAVTAAGAPVTISVEGTEQALPPDVDHVAYRILQEALTNVLRHAGPSARATVCLRYERDAVAIRVTDDGGDPATGRPGGGVPAAPAGGGHGLTGMAERAAAVGGEVTAAALAGGGFEVLARLPLAAGGGAA